MSQSWGSTGEFPLRGHHGVADGLVAWAQPSHPDGNNDRPKPPKRVQVRAEPPVADPQRPEGVLSETDWRWAVASYRQWRSVTKRLGDNAEAVALGLARSGCVALDHNYRFGAVLQPPLGWIPHPSLVGDRIAEQAARRGQQDELAARARDLSAVLAAEWPGAAAALTLPSSDPRLPWLVHAGEDLAAGLSHDGVRAFVQAHVGHTKARDDLPRLLASSGFEPDALALLGVNRNPYIGLGGPVLARLSGRTLGFTGWPGPVDVRLPADCPITIDVAAGTSVLAVIENRQAAEAICDQYPAVALIWCHGQPPAPVLALISQAAAQLDKVVICPDADLGGIRIAARIHDHLPTQTRRTVVDIGTVDHIAGHSFSADVRQSIARLAERRDGVGDLARGCLTRGYAIEQEAPVRAALREVL